MLVSWFGILWDLLAVIPDQSIEENCNCKKQEPTDVAECVERFLPNELAMDKRGPRYCGDVGEIQKSQRLTGGGERPRPFQVIPRWGIA